MLKSLHSNSAYLDVQGGNPGSVYINLSSVNPATGAVRVNGQDMEVFDGNQWQRFGGSYASVSLNNAAIQALDWCQRKMIEEAKIKELAEKNVTVADALEKYNQAKEQLEVVLRLTD